MLGKSSTESFTADLLQETKRADSKIKIKRIILLYLVLRSKTFSIRVHFSLGSAMGSDF